MSVESDFSLELCDSLCVVLKEARIAAGLSLGETAARAGLNRQAVTFIEKGERRPSTDTLTRLSLALGMRPSEAWLKAEAALSVKSFRRLPSKPAPS